MTTTAFLVVMLAAFLHATWNALVKGGGDKMFTTVLVTGSASLISLFLLPFLPAPARASWPFLAFSGLLQALYFLLVARTYRVTEMSQSYPLMRGIAPLLVSLASIGLFDEPLLPAGWIGIGLICLGVLSTALGKRTRPGRLCLTLATAAMIAVCTLVDGLGVRRSGAPMAYVLWVFLMTGPSLLMPAILRSGPALAIYARANWRLGLAGGMGTLASYGLSLWVMTFAPVALVSALRETSILFAMVISGLLLGERVGFSRIVTGALILSGAIVLRLG